MCAPHPAAIHDRPPWRCGKLVCAGKNYAAHVRAVGDPAPRGRPVLFLKPAEALLPPGGSPWLPPGCEALHPEAELVMVIGRGGRDLDLATALGHVEAWAAGLDMTDRGWQADAKRHGWPWEWAKAFDGAAALGSPVPAAKVPDWRELRVRLRVDGELRQEVDPRLMLHDPARLLALASERFTLRPGDLVFTGAPAGTAAVTAGEELWLELARASNETALPIILAASRLRVSRRRPEEDA